LLVVGSQTLGTATRLERFAAQYPGILELRPAMPQVSAFEIMRESTMLLLLNNTRYPGVVPLKTFDYMASGTPILVFGTAGAGGGVVASTAAGVQISENDTQALAAGFDILRSRPRSEWNGPRREAWCAEHNRSVLFERLLCEIDALRGRGTA